MRKVSSARSALVAGFLLTFVLFLPQTPSAAAPADTVRDSSPAIISTWTEPTVVYAEAWPDPLRFSLDDDATTLVALIPYSGSSETSRQIVASKRMGGIWQPPVVIAEMRVDVPDTSVSDAVMMLDLRNTNALLFRNVGTGAYNMVYRRHDGTIGWVEPNRA